MVQHGSHYALDKVRNTGVSVCLPPKLSFDILNLCFIESQHLYRTQIIYLRLPSSKCFNLSIILQIHNSKYTKYFECHFIML